MPSDFIFEGQLVGEKLCQTLAFGAGGDGVQPPAGGAPLRQVPRARQAGEGLPLQVSL